jgi:acetyl esterase/lipase
MNSELNIHPDFQSIKGMKTPTKPLPLALMAAFLSTINALYLKKYKTIVSKRKITGPDGYQIPLLIIKPENLPAASPALIYYHGGAFVFKHAPPHIDNAVRYAREANCLVVFVDYRLAPKYPFPAGFNDCYAALQWTVANADKLGVDKQRIAVGGDSAGGAFAAAAAQKAVHEDGIKLCGQMLIYPVTDSNGNWPSFATFGNVPPFKGLSNSGLWDIYLGHPLAEGTPPYAAPLQGDVSGVAPAYVETAEFCPLHDQGNAYAKALLAKGIEVSMNATKGTLHGFDLMAGKSEISKAAVTTRIQYLRKIFQI